MTGLDYSRAAIARAQRAAAASGVEVSFVLDDLTDLQHIEGTYDLVMDFGALNDLNRED